MRPVLRICRHVAALLVVGLVPAHALAQSTDVFKGFSGNSKSPIQVDAATLEVYEQDTQRVSVFSGGVTVRRGDTTMKAATIKLYSDKNGGENGFTRIEASGTVYVNSGNQTATGSDAVVDNKAKTITLTGNVVLSRGKDVVTGQRLVINMDTGSARVDPQTGGRVQVLITPNDKKSGGDSQPDSGGTKPASGGSKPAAAASTPNAAANKPN